MSQFYKCMLCAVGFLFLCAQSQCNQDVPKSEKTLASIYEEEPVDILTIEPKEAAPSYDKLVPVPGWDRYSGDSARSIKGWCRWWKYLCMKEPVVMKWIDGLNLRIYPSNEVFRALFVRGIYDPNLVITVNSVLRKGGVLIDVGSNMGYFSLLASRVVGEEGRIFALEPSKRDFVRLVDNININNLNTIISPYRLAVTDKVGSAKLAVACEERSALNTLGTEFSFKGVEKKEVEEVSTTTIDAFVAENDIDRVDVLKLDIEGSELDALHGAKNTIEKYRPMIMLGINNSAWKACNADINELAQALKDLRYRAYELVEAPTFALKPFTDLASPHVKIVFCFHESVIPPVLPQPEKRSISDKISDFFLR